MSERISGTLAAAVTPLRDDGDRVDEDALAPLLSFYEASGMDGVLVLGTTGEGIMLRDDERRRVAELAMAGGGSSRSSCTAGRRQRPRPSLWPLTPPSSAPTAPRSSRRPIFSSTPMSYSAISPPPPERAPLPFYVYEYADRSGYEIPVEVVERLRENVQISPG